jgi:uncharacterized membrane protein
VETIYQGDEEGCGLASLRMLLILVSHEANYRYLTLEGHPPYSLEELTRAAAKEGLGLKFKRVQSKEDLVHNTSWPILLLYGKEEDSHCVVAVKKRGSKILIDDPSEGKRWESIPAIERRWNGIYGEVVSYFATRCPYKKKRVPLPAGIVLASFFEILSEAALYFGFYNVQKDADYLYSVIFFALFGLFSIIKRSFAVWGMKAFDKGHLESIYDPDPHRLRSNYEHYYRYKALLFGGWIEFLSALFFSSALLALVGFNSPYFLASAGGFLIYVLFEALYWRKNLQKEKSALENDEKTLFLSKESADEKKRSILSLSQKAYRLGDYVSYSQAVRFVLSLALALIPMLASQAISLNYFLFHFFALLAIGDGFEKVVSFFMKGRERSQEFDYFLEYFLKEGE